MVISSTLYNKQAGFAEPHSSPDKKIENKSRRSGGWPVGWLNIVPTQALPTGLSVAKIGPNLHLGLILYTDLGMSSSLFIVDGPAHHLSSSLTFLAMVANVPLPAGRSWPLFSLTFFVQVACVFFAFYDQRSVAEAWTTPSPWIILNCKYQFH